MLQIVTKSLRIRILGVALAAAANVPLVLAQPDSEPERFADDIHSDLPLFGDETEEKWPQRYSDAESNEFGCDSRVAFGDWALKLSGSEEVETWYRISNYGIIHCFAIVGAAYERDYLDYTDSEPAFFVKLGTSGDVELWALQIGGAPGSDYLLFSREPTEETISKFTVLQRKCARQNVRDAGPIDILLTRYCAINSKTDLLRFARRMAKLEPLGELTLIGRDNDHLERFGARAAPLAGAADFVFERKN